VAVTGAHPPGCKDASGNALSVDQRGVKRLGPCDIGAYERVLFAFLPLIRR